MRRINVLATALAVALTGLLGVAGGARAGSFPPGQTPRSCFWTDIANRNDNNILFPDTEASYWYSRSQLSPGAKVVLHGLYPHARYLSLSSYGTESGRSGVATDALHDESIRPDRGSINPFRDWAPRLLPGHRSYTVTLSGDAPPPGGESREPNTLYTGHPGLTGGKQAVEIVLRVYTPDRFRDPMGGAGLPEATFVPAGETPLSGQAACDALGTAGGKLPNTAIPLDQYLALLALSPDSTHPAVDPVRWDAFFNRGRLVEPFYRGTAAAALIPGLPTERVGSYYSNSDNSYVVGYIDRSFGPDRDGHNILVLRGRMPTTPRTYRGDFVMRGGTQLRYWSLCQNESLASGRVAGECLYDETVPTDRDGKYTIVVSLPEDRPANATKRCGVAWLDWGRTGDGSHRERGGLLVMRNMLSAPSFTHTPADVTTPGAEAAVMGDYLPSGSYTSRAAFAHQRPGCR